MLSKKRPDPTAIKPSRMIARRNYSNEHIIAAVNVVKKKEMSISEAARHFGIPRKTLSDKVCGKTKIEKRMGPDTFLTQAEEKVIVQYIISAQKRALPVTKDTVISLVQSILSDERNLAEINRDRPYKFGRAGSYAPGDKWYSLFLKRYPQIVVRMTEALSSARRHVSKNVIQQWFADVKGYFDENDCIDLLNDPSRHFNIDETGFILSPKIPRVLALKGSKNVHYATTGKEKERLTVLANIGANGSIPPPLIIYANMRIPNSVLENLPDMSIAVGKSKTGYITFEVLYEYLCNAFDEWLTKNNIKRPVVVWADKHETRISYHLVKMLKELKIILIVLPPNCTHLLQPLDVGMFFPLKKAWETEVKNFKSNNPNNSVNRANFATVFMPLYMRVMSKEKIINAFRKCGLQPYDDEAPDYSKLTKEAEHASSACLFEGIDQGNFVERGTQVEKCKTIHRSTQVAFGTCERHHPNVCADETSPTQLKNRPKLFLGVHKTILESSWDDSVIEIYRFLPVRYSVRQRWFQFRCTSNRSNSHGNNSIVNESPRDGNEAETNEATGVDVTATVGTMSSPGPSSFEPKNQKKRSNISPAMKNYRWHPSPKKTYAPVRTVVQELHATSVLTSDKVVTLLKEIKEKKCQVQQAKEERKVKRLKMMEAKKSKSDLRPKSKKVTDQGVKKVSGKKGNELDKHKSVRKRVEYSSSSDSEVGFEPILNDDSDSNGSFTMEVEGDIHDGPCVFPDDPKVGSWVAAKLLRVNKTTKVREASRCAYEIFFGKVISVLQDNDKTNYVVKFMKEKVGSKFLGLYIWPEQDDHSLVKSDELVVICSPQEKCLGKFRTEGYIFPDGLMEAVKALLVRNQL